MTATTAMRTSWLRRLFRRAPDVVRGQKTAGRAFSRRQKTFVPMIAVIASLALLLYLEQIAVIYVLATLTLVVFLIVVATTDLQKVGREEDSNSENY